MIKVLTALAFPKKSFCHCFTTGLEELLLSLAKRICSRVTPNFYSVCSQIVSAKLLNERE